MRQDANPPQDPPHDASKAPAPEVPSTAQIEAASTQATSTQAASTQEASTQAASTQNSKTSEPRRNSESMDADMDGEDDDDPSSLSQNEKLAIIRAISDAPDHPELFKQALDKALPFPVDFKTLQALIHPDKYQDKEEKGQATVAFQKLLTFRDKSGNCMPGEADRHTNFYHGNANHLQEHVEGQLSPSHKQIHQLATQHLQVLFSALARNPRMDPYKAGGLEEDAQAAVNQLNDMNAMMKAENEKEKRDPELGKIRYDDLFGLWRPMFLQPELKASQTTAILDWCRRFGYPADWAVFNTQPFSANPSRQEAGDKSGNSIQLWNATGGKMRTVAIVPRRTTRSLRPGYTSSGEKIRMIQHLGLFSARFVVEDTQGRVWLRSSAASGGQPALDGAKNVGTPTTMQDATEIAQLRDAVRQGGDYGLDWVAVGEWDPTRKALPFIVVGFWHKGIQGSLQESGLSRAALKKILAPREAERLIAESMTSDPDLSLKEALYLICPDAKPVTTSALPSSNMGYPWFQQLPPALNAPQALPIQQLPGGSQFNYPPQYQFPPEALQAFAQAQQLPYQHLGLQSTGVQVPGSFEVPPQPLFNFPKYSPAMSNRTAIPEEL